MAATSTLCDRIHPNATPKTQNRTREHPMWRIAGATADRLGRSGYRGHLIFDMTLIINGSISPASGLPEILLLSVLNKIAQTTPSSLRVKIADEPGIAPPCQNRCPASVRRTQKPDPYHESVVSASDGASIAASVSGLINGSCLRSSANLSLIHI